MKIWNLSILALKQVLRHPLRSALTIVGVATGLFLFTTVETMQQSLQEATSVQAGDNTLIVYRENRFCPFTSRLPEHYTNRIAAIDGVREVTPVQVVVNNCSTSLDVVTFRGAPREQLTRYAERHLQLLDGDLQNWLNRSDAAIIGEVLARRRNLSTGDTFESAGVKVQVAGIIASDQAMDRNVAYVHLDFLQQASRVGLGIVTQFNVMVDDPNRMEQVADAIDAEFASDQEPTHTRPEKAFVAQVAKDLLELIGFTRYVALGAVAAVLALIANTILLTVRGRVKEHAILQTLGFGDRAIAWLVLCEGLCFGLLGGLLGVGSATAVLYWGGYSLSSEGLSLVFQPAWSVIVVGILVSTVLGMLAAVIPAWQSGRQAIVTSLRMS